MSASSPGQVFIGKFERALIKGSARWVADFNEFFRDYPLGNITFDLFARGRTRNRGLFLSRFFAWTALPDYSVSLFCVDATESGRLSVERLRRMIEVALQTVRSKELKWAWLIAISGQELSPQVVSFVSRYDRYELGLAAASTLTRELVVSNTHIGRSIKKQLKLGKLLRAFDHGQAS